MRTFHCDRTAPSDSERKGSGLRSRWKLGRNGVTVLEMLGVSRAWQFGYDGRYLERRTEVRIAQ